MSTAFPNGIDSFANPNTTKTNGSDYVKAQHMNDAQDAIRALQICMVGSGLNMKIGSNYYLPEDCSVKTALTIIDETLHAIDATFDLHHDSVLITDPIQHHANVIEVSSGSGAVFADIMPKRVQTVLEVIRTEINKILDGQTVRGKNLSNLYPTKQDPANYESTISVAGDATFLSNVNIGTDLTSKLSVAGEMQVLGAVALGDILFNSSNISLTSNGKIGLKDNLNYGYLSFNDVRTEIGSKRDIVLRLDRDALINPSQIVSKFQILNSADNIIAQITNDGETTLAGTVSVNSLISNSSVTVGQEEKLELTHNKINTAAQNVTVIMDNTESHISSKFTVNVNGYTGEDTSNDDLIFQVTEGKMVSGTAYLKPGLTEKGDFGLKFLSHNPGGEFQGYFVPFRQMKTVIPTVTIRLDSQNSINTNTVQVAYVTTCGFFIECDSVNTGTVFLRGQYEA